MTTTGWEQNAKYWQSMYSQTQIYLNESDITNEKLEKENKRLRKALESISFVYEDTNKPAYDQQGMIVIAQVALDESK